jgi:hypothetical protein
MQNPVPSKFSFEVLIDDSFSNFSSDDLEPVENKNVLSLINDFEDGSWRYSKFQNFIWDNIAETALSFRERESLANQSHSSLVAAAKNLRLTDKDKKDIGKGSELAEILLYGVMKHHYNSLPIVPKIFYKQNAQDNAKGSDSVHIVIENEDSFSLWLGESKFYDSIADDRLDSIVQSVFNALQKDKLKKENSIITSVSDLENFVKNSKLLENIRDLLSNDNSIDDLKPFLHIPILLLHECPLTKSCRSLSQDYKDSIIKYHKERAEAYFRKQITKLKDVIFKYSEITFHIILFPVPDKSEIVDRFISNVEHYKGQG